MNWISKIKEGLSKTSETLSTGIFKIFREKKLDKVSIEELEELLIESDVGARMAATIASEFAANKYNKDITNEQILGYLATILADKLKGAESTLEIKPNTLNIILFCGVNGSGKTTTIGKLASKYKQMGHKVMIAACDTFRAAATDQLVLWAKRSDTTIITGAERADPASVAHKAIEQAISQEYDILFIDTAGRLHNKVDLMNELSKIKKVITNKATNSTQKVVLILDATTGQNAILQAQTFKSTIHVDGIIITKLDTSARAGVIIPIVDQLKLPIYYMCCGEHIEDVIPFNSDAFAHGMLGLQFNK